MPTSQRARHTQQKKKKLRRCQAKWYTRAHGPHAARLGCRHVPADADADAAAANAIGSSTSRGVIQPLVVGPW
jgi:hypothetical protein